MRKELFEAEVNLNKIIDIETQGAITRARAPYTDTLFTWLEVAGY